MQEAIMRKQSRYCWLHLIELSAPTSFRTALCSQVRLALIPALIPILILILALTLISVTVTAIVTVIVTVTE